MANDAAWELGQRRSIRREFGLWCEHALAPQGLVPAAHHRLLIRELQAVADGVHDRLMVFMPPGSAKSTYTSDLFPAWFLAQGRDRRVIATSNTADLAGTFSRRVRGRIRSHGPMLGYRLEREAEDLWTTSNGGEYRAAGIGGVITGLRADLALIDDPVKSREEADSEARRARVWEWFQDDLRTRLRPGAAIVVVQTRWHQDDLSGRLLEAQGDQWRVVSLPAEAEVDDPLGRAPGEMLWGDDGYGYAASLHRVKAEASTRSWSALYMQRPVPDTGDYFQAEWLRHVDVLPDRTTMRIYGGSDYAVTADGGDFTVHAVVGMDPAGQLWLLDLWRGQTAADAWIEAFCDLVTRWRPIGWAEETGQIRAGIGPFLQRRMRERQAYVARHAFPTRGDKAVRAQSIRGRMALEGLHLPRHAPWRQALEAELVTFPAGKHDDQVDALGLIGQLLDQMVTGPAARPEPAPPKDSWARLFDRLNDGDVEGWKVA
ncbi:phage terminase large subunit [Roseomonas terrae]|uniref:Phage terminase large subunit n=1 Tax=Neoroseomonas terrae TaxID=424799 RepID=A0ABS5ECI7_9PROT|nr:phage terminase large subunit [Neoroseomonas terrae]MBR0648730.1 phage terminase large subunit [Neoroseomonas terrae]